jgi:dipeptidyl aminopeptidase/acylaminoacyl peptidase
MLIFTGWSTGGRSGIFAAQNDGSELRCLTSSFNLERYQRLRPSPDGKHLLLLAQPPAEERARFFLLNLDNLHLEPYERQPQPYDMRWLGGESFLCIRQDRRWIARVGETSFEELPFLEGYLIIDIARDRNRILLKRTRGNGSVYVGYLDRKRVVEVICGEDYERSHEIVTPSSWSPDGRTIACVGGYEDEVWLVDADGGHPRKLAQSDYFWRSMQWSPSSLHIAYMRSLDNRGPDSERAGVYVADVAQGQERQVFSIEHGEAWRWSPEGDGFLRVLKGEGSAALASVEFESGRQKVLIGSKAGVADISELIVI